MRGLAAVVGILLTAARAVHVEMRQVGDAVVPGGSAWPSAR